MSSLSKIVAAVVILLFFPFEALASEQPMEIIVDHATVAFINIPAATVRAIAKTNSLPDPDTWRKYGSTGLPPLRVPEGIVHRAEKHPEWNIKSLSSYAITVRDYSESGTRQRVFFLYRSQANVLFLLYRERPEKSNNPNSPF